MLRSKTITAFFIFGVLYMLSSCAQPTIFGMPEKEFNHLQIDQQEQVILSYKKQQEQEKPAPKS